MTVPRATAALTQLSVSANSLLYNKRRLFFLSSLGRIGRTVYSVSLIWDLWIVLFPLSKCSVHIQRHPSVLLHREHLHGLFEHRLDITMTLGMTLQETVRLILGPLIWQHLDRYAAHCRRSGSSDSSHHLAAGTIPR